MRSMPLQKRVTTAPLALTAAMAIALAVGHVPSVYAQSGAAATATMTINIPAQPLGQALNELARQANLQMTFPAALVAGKQARAVSGQLTAQQAIDRMLSGTGLMAATEGSAVVVRQSPVQPSGGATLPTVQVVGTTREGSAADGYRVDDSALVGFTDRSIRDTPRSIRVISADLIKDQRVTDLDALGRLDASVTASYKQPGFHARTEIRGFDVADGQNYRYNGMLFLRQQLTPLENKQRVEVLKGLSAFEAGFAAPSGVINFVTKRPTVEPLTDLNLSFDQYGDALAHIDLSRRFDDGRVGLRINAAAETLRSYIDETPGNRQFASLAADWRLTNRTLLTFDAEYQARKQVLQPSFRPTASGTIPRNVDPTRFIGQSWAVYDTDNLTLSGRLEHRFNDAWTGIVEGNWNRTLHPFNEASVVNLQDNGAGTVSAFIASGTKREAETLRPMVQGRFATGGLTHELVFGYALQSTSARNGDSFSGQLGPTNLYAPVQYPKPTTALTRSQSGFTVKDSGFFLQDVISFSDAWMLHVGGRQANIDQRSINAAGAESARYEKSRFSPNAAIVFKPMPDVTTYLSYAEGVENGGVAPQTFNSQPVTNAGSIRPVLVSEQWEAGVKAPLSPRVDAELSVFQIERPSDFVDNTLTFVREGNRVHRGVELSLAGRVSNEWTLLGSALLLDAALERTGDATTEGKRPTSVPKRRYTLTAEYSPSQLPGWAFNANWSYTGNRPLDNAHRFEFAPSFEVVNLGFRYRTTLNRSGLAAKAITVRGGVANLFDKRYFSTSNFGQLVNGAPRTVSLGVDMSF